MSVIPQTLRASGGLRPLCPLPGLCPGLAGDLKRSPDPSRTHAPTLLTTIPGSAPAVVEGAVHNILVHYMTIIFIIGQKPTRACVVLFKYADYK
jgi:hypothetical protein